MSKPKAERFSDLGVNANLMQQMTPAFGQP